MSTPEDAVTKTKNVGIKLLGTVGRQRPSLRAMITKLAERHAVDRNQIIHCIDGRFHLLTGANKRFIPVWSKGQTDLARVREDGGMEVVPYPYLGSAISTNHPKQLIHFLLAPKQRKPHRSHLEEAMLVAELEKRKKSEK